MNCDKCSNINEFDGIRTMLLEDIEECKQCSEFEDDFYGHWCCFVYET